MEWKRNRIGRTRKVWQMKRKGRNDNESLVEEERGWKGERGLKWKRKRIGRIRRVW